jgi:hypothetical protein
MVEETEQNEGKYFKQFKTLVSQTVQRKKKLYLKSNICDCGTKVGRKY